MSADQQHSFIVSADGSFTPKHRAWKSIAERFDTFHRANPHIYRRIVQIARQMQARGVRKMGISLIFERLRWLHFIEVKTDEGFKLSNDFRADNDYRIRPVRFLRDTRTQKIGINTLYIGIDNTAGWGVSLLQRSKQVRKGTDHHDFNHSP